MTVLITAGMGFIGSHTAVVLAERGYKSIILDNLCNSKADVIDRIERITGIRPPFVEGDIRDVRVLEYIFQNYAIDAVIYFAGLKAVGESVQKPLEYYDNNVRGTVNLLSSMRRFGVRKMIFSSFATVYGAEAAVPYTETSQRSATNPYGRTKLMVEDILNWEARRDINTMCANARKWQLLSERRVACDI